VKTSPAKIAANVALVVKTRRSQLKLSQEDLADKASIDRTYASQIERAIANPSLTVLCNLANALNISLAQLLGESALAKEALVVTTKRATP
jgi:transcriptional regulator with XRE-family HTH domain